MDADAIVQQVWSDVAKAKTEDEYSKAYDKAAEIEDRQKYFPVTTASEIMKRKKDRRFIVERFLLPKTVNMVYSRPGTFKSYLMLDMALCVAGGDDWMGMKTHKGKVLILDKENSDSMLRDRLVNLVAGHGWKRKANPRLLHMLLRQGDLWSDTFVGNLSTYIKENRIQLLVFDTIRRFGDFEENSSDSINKIYLAFQRIINGTDCAIVFLHHANKESGTYRGSVDLLGQVDSAYRVEREGKQDFFKLICEKSRTGEIDEVDGQIEFGEEKTVISRRDVEDTTEHADAYAKFRAARVQTLNEIAALVPMAGGTFVRARVWAEIDADNSDKEASSRVSLRTIARVLDYLCKRKFLAKTGQKGEYRRLFSGSNGIWKAQGEINAE